MKTFFLFIVIFCQIFSQENFEIKDESSLKILTPSFKERKTAKLLLKNGLAVYIVSDKQIDKSSAALAVSSGSWQDPKKYPGMAHYTEHMLFMGTKAYPGEKAFSSFITDHGGSNNAYTKCDRTVYGFSINNDAFLAGLDRFSHFFIDPILPKDGMKRELHAVDQEYSKNIENDGWRKYQVEKETSNPEHPHSGFSTGNSKTLANIPQEEMRKWIEENYSASLMHLFVYSPLDIDELKEKIIEYFSKVPNRNLHPSPNRKEVFSSLQKGKIIYLEPVKDMQIVSISWELPHEYLDDPSQSAELLAYSLSIGSSNSLLELLKKENLAKNLEAYIDRIGKQAAFFNLDVELTDKGIAEFQKVLELSFDTLKTYSQRSFPYYLFDERKNMAIVEYEYQSRSNSFDFAMNSADQMADESLSSFPSKSIVPSRFDKSKVEKLLKILTPTTSRVFVISDPKKTKVTLTNQEKWLGGRYAIAKLPEPLLHTKILSSIDLPPPNSFIPHNLVLKQTKAEKVPLKISDTEMGQAFYYPDHYYQVPKITYLLDIQSSYIEPNALSSSMVDLYLLLCQDILMPTLISAKNAGLVADLVTDKLSLKLAVAGYSEKADLLLQDVLKGMKTIPSEEQFDNQKTALLKAYQNKKKDLPCSQALNLGKTILVNDVAPYQKRYDALKNISYDTFVSFHKLLLHKAYIEAIYTGNLTKQEAEFTHKKMLSTLKAEPFKDRYTRKVFQFPEDQGPYMITKSTECLGSSCFLVLDQGDLSFEKRALQQVLAQALKSDFFDSLRTKQKTGYIAQSWDASIENQLFQFFIVQSSSHEPLDLLYRFDLFLEDYAQSLSSKIPIDRFTSIKNSIIDQLKTPPVNLFENAYLLQKLAFEYRDFNWIEERIKGVKNLSFKDFLINAQPLLSRLNKKRIAILYSGKMNKESEFRYEPITFFEIKKIANYTSKKQNLILRAEVK